MHNLKRFSLAEAKQMGDVLGINWHSFDVKQFLGGLAVEHEHGALDAQTNVTNG